MSDILSEQPQKKPVSKLSGLGVVAMIFWIGLVALYAPTFMRITDAWAIVWTALGIVLLSISFYGTLQELGTFLKSRGHYWVGDGLSGIGVGFVFLIPGVALGFATTYLLLGELLLPLQCLSLALVALGGGGGVYSAILMFTRSDEPAPAGSSTLITPEGQQVSKSKATVVTLLHILLAGLAIAADVIAVVQLIAILVPSE